MPENVEPSRPHPLAGQVPSPRPALERPPIWPPRRRSAADAAANRLRTVVAALNAIVWERSPETLRVRFTNRRAEDLLGYPVPMWFLDHGLPERIIHPDDAPKVLTELRRAIATGHDYVLSYRARTADDRWLFLEHLGHVTRDEAGHACALHEVLFDVTARQRSERAAALVAIVTGLLTAEVPAFHRLKAVAAQIARQLNSRVAIWVRDAAGGHRAVAVAPWQVAHGLLAEPAVSARGDGGWGAAFVVHRPRHPMAVTGPGDQEFYQRLAAVSPHSVLVAPVFADDRLCGMLTLGSPAGGRCFDQADLALADDLARRMATAVAMQRG